MNKIIVAVRGDRRGKAAIGMASVRYGWSPRCSTRTTLRWPGGPGRRGRRTTGTSEPLRVTAERLNWQVSRHG
jgi:hypothetical protein